jgi:ankyrin repeat protein
MRQPRTSMGRHVASSLGQVEVACMLIKLGADTTVQNKHGETPLHFVLKSSFSFKFLDPYYARVAATLLEHGADVNAKNTDGLTPFRLASQRGLAELTRVLLEHGADPGEISAPESPPVTLSGPSLTHTHTDLSTPGHPSPTTPNYAVTDSQTQSPSRQPSLDDSPPEQSLHSVFFDRHLIFSLGIVAIAMAILWQYLF